MNIKFSFCLFIIYCLISNAAFSNSVPWAVAQKEKKASLDIHWYISNPFIYLNGSNEIEGLEVDILKEFQIYVKETHGVNLLLNWKKSQSFYNILQDIAGNNKANAFGVSAFSITDDRKKQVDFTDSYLSDVAVLVSSKGTPIVKTLREINEMMGKMTAVTIKGTTYEQQLMSLKKQLNLDFKIKYIESDQNILDIIGKEQHSFGFIDLPIYLMSIKRGENFTRQNFFTIEGNGYGFIMPKGSDWKFIFSEFLNDPKTRVKLAKITSRYMGPEVFNFIDGLYKEENISTSILTKEKEIQLEQLRTASLLIEKEKNNQFAYIAIAVTTTMLLGIIFTLFYKEQKSARALGKKNMQIEQQQLSIQSKNEQLHNRNLQLTSLNEEKNNLVKILAHDLRSPINQITGLIEVLKMSHDNFSKEGEKIIHQVQDSTSRLNQMISKILDFDALEGNRMKVNREKVNSKELFETIEKELSIIAAKKDISIQYEIEDLSFSSDHMFLTQILENIMVNAIKFSDPGSSVMVKVYQEDKQAMFAIADEGPGLTQEDKSLIFKKFQKLSAKPTGGENSTGLGLSIVKKYVDLLDGKVWVESEKGKGSTFFIALPLS